LPDWLFFDPEGETERERRAAARTAEKPEKGRRLFCAACRHPVTHQDERIEVHGRHMHTCTNPYGFTYTFGCFREAPGCVARDEPTAEHSWFRGYAWQIALCANCHNHLGWRFVSSGDYFFGLILERLSSLSDKSG
jgi:hypothetical protein